MRGENAENAFLQKLEKLAFCRSNDAVKLAFLGEDALSQIGRLDLSALTEFHRLSNGTVEMKFVDRVKLLELLKEVVQGSAETGKADLVSAINSAAERLAAESTEGAGIPDDLS